MQWLAQIEKALKLEIDVLTYAQAPFLLLVRLYWGYAFATNGWGKLHHIEDIAKWFGDDLHIPMPLANAYAAASTEFLGGIFLLLGLGGRIATIPLVITMCVAYLTSDLAGFHGLYWSAQACADAPIDVCQPFEDAAPFSFLMASLVVLLFGAGPLSLDGVIAWQWSKRAPAPPPG